MAEGGTPLNYSEKNLSDSNSSDPDIEKSACYLLFKSSFKSSDNNECSPSTSSLVNSIPQSPCRSSLANSSGQSPCRSGAIKKFLGLSGINSSREKKWPCKLCKFLNVDAAEQCIICSSLRPQDDRQV